MSKLSEFNDENKNDFFKNNESDTNTNQNLLKEKMESMLGKDSNELNDELLKEVAKQKENGEFDYQKLNDMMTNFRGILGEENYNKMKEILESIK